MTIPEYEALTPKEKAEHMQMEKIRQALERIAGALENLVELDKR